MTAYDSVERADDDEYEPLRGRRPRTFTLTQLLVACVAVCVCSIAATTVVNTHLVNAHEDSALANFDDDYPEEAQLGRKDEPTNRHSTCRMNSGENFFQVCEKKLQVCETCKCVNPNFGDYEAYCAAHPSAYDCKPSAQKNAPGSRYLPTPGPDECIPTDCTPNDCTPNDCKA